MPAWPGGPCPECGEDMPPRLMTCQSCRAPLNSDLIVALPDLPEFIPFEEVTEDETPDSEVRLSGEISADQEFVQAPEQPAIADAPILGIYINCPQCANSLKVDRKYIGQNVQCKFCESPFLLDQRTNPSMAIQAVYCACPHCNETLKAATGYVGQSVQCKHCQGYLKITR